MKKTIFTLFVLSAALFADSPAVSASDEGAAHVADETRNGTRDPNGDRA